MSQILFCNQCGMANVPGAMFCSSCGASMSPAAVAAPSTDPSASPMAPAVAQPGAYQAAAVYPAAAPYTGMVPAAGVHYGGFWIRFVAAIIDAIIVQVVVVPLSFVAGGVTGFAGAVGGIAHAGLPILGGAIGFGIGLVGSWLYEAFLESSQWQATLGKMIFGMKVTDLNGNRIDFGRATGRHFAKWLSTLILCFGYIMVGFTERKQGLHDMVAGTLVRRT